MLTDQRRIDALVAYAISLTGKPGASARSIGRVQLMKLVYLADLAIAEKSAIQVEVSEAATYTGATWRFLHYGPFASDVAARMEPAAAAVRATVLTYHHDETDSDHERWSGDGVEIPPEVQREIPVRARMAIERALKEHGGDTQSLLAAVYLTAPMIGAAPGETLDFRMLPVAATHPPQVSPAEAKRRREVAARLRAKLADAPRSRRRVKVVPEYDDQFTALVLALGEEAGEPGEFDGVVEFPGDLWKSGWRGGGGNIP